MSGGIACKCKPRAVQVLRRNYQCSAFNGYRRQYSSYSSVECLSCGTVWRTKAAYVDDAPDAPTHIASVRRMVQS